MVVVGAPRVGYASLCPVVVVWPHLPLPRRSSTTTTSSTAWRASLATMSASFAMYVCLPCYVHRSPYWPASLRPLMRWSSTAAPLLIEWASFPSRVGTFVCRADEIYMSRMGSKV